MWDPNKKLVQDANPMAPVAAPVPLSRDAFIDPKTGAERPINNIVTNPTNYAADVKTGQANADINRQIDAIAHDTTKDSATKAADMKALFQTKVAPVGITPEMRTQIVNEQNLPQNQYVPIRDLEAEKKQAAKFGLDPNNPQDVIDGQKATYTTPKLAAMITNGEIDTTHWGVKDLNDVGLTADRIKQLVDQTTDPAAKQRLQGLYDKIVQTGGAVGQAASVMNATPAPTNRKMDVLAEALNAKNNYKNQTLGTSDLFKAAGLSGYSVLAQSLAQRQNEMQDKSKSALNMISEVSGDMLATYKAVTDQYNTVLKEYDKQTQMLLDIDAQAKKHEEAIDLMNQQDALDKKTYAWKKEIDDKYATDKTEPRFDSDGNFLGYWDAATKTFVQDGGNSSTTSIGATDSNTWPAQKSVIQDTFYQPGKGKYGDGEGQRQCGEGANAITNGKKVGDSYDSKMAVVPKDANGNPKQDNPQVGNELVIPLGVKKSSIDPGHIEVVTQIDPANDILQTVSWNRDGRTGTQTTQTYKLSELKAKYGNNWGFSDSSLKPEYANKLAKSLPASAPTEVPTGGLTIGPSGGIVPETAPQEKPTMIDLLYTTLTSADDKLAARDPKSTLRKRFDKLPEEEQKQYIQDLKALANKGREV